MDPALHCTETAPAKAVIDFQTALFQELCEFGAQK